LEAIDSQGGLAYSSAMSMKKLITEKLSAAFAPQSLDVIDESHMHAGHAGHRPGGETHYRVHIVSEAFRGKSRVDRHRMVNQTLSGELASTVHALAINARAPGEG
jgi:BolA family transcriptional regulator, general stress-responsive regulator